MKILALLLVLLLPCASWSEPVRVQSGEHKGFSRLVLNGVAAQDWVFGRTSDGYAMKLAGDPPGFDVSDVYRLISHDRISALWVDPKSGALNLRIACACHALPYELQPGVLVIDVTDGPAPAGSSFEAALNGAVVPALDKALPTRPKRRPGAAVLMGPAIEFPTAKDMAVAAPDANLPVLRDLTTQTPDMAPLRDTLLRQLSDGSARGVVTLQLPVDAPENPPLDPDKNALTGHIRVGDDLGLIILPGGKEGARDKLMADGSACPSAEALDLVAWGADAAVVSAIGPATSGLLGEFDNPDPVAMERAVKYLLHLGFGAEALGLMTAFHTSLPDQDNLVSIAQILEGDPDAQPIFAPMAGCDTPAALWAALATPDLSELTDLNRGAVLRGFSALPPPIRRYLGPGLSDRFLAQNDPETARALTDSILRGAAADAAVNLAEAHVELALGDGDNAEQALSDVASGNSPAAAQAMIALVDTRVSNGQSVAPDQISALAALVQEYRGSETEPSLLRGLALAQASGGEFGPAFETAKSFGADLPEIWTILAEQGADDALLIYGVVAGNADLPPVSSEIRQKFARRLMGLGLPGPAQRWLTETAGTDAQGLKRLGQNDTNRLLGAEADILRRDAPSAMRQLAGQTGADADRLRARAFELMDQPKEALRQYAALQDAEGVGTAARNANDWTELVADTDPVWSAAAELVVPKPAGEAGDVPGPLARSRALLEESTAARTTINQLLAGVPAPKIP